MAPDPSARSILYGPSCMPGVSCIEEPAANYSARVPKAPPRLTFLWGTNQIGNPPASAAGAGWCVTTLFWPGFRDFRDPKVPSDQTETNKGATPPGFQREVAGAM